MTVVKVPALSLVVLVGISGSGKSTFAARHFLATEVIWSDFCRGLVSDDQNDQSATADAFEVLHFIAGKRLAAGRLTVIDATSVQAAARKSLIALARQHHVLAVAVVLDIPEADCAARNAARADRAFGAHVLRQQQAQLRSGLRGLRQEGFHRVFVLRGAAEVDATVIEREPLWNDRKTDHGPFDIIGDVHGCHAELAELLGRLGYTVDADGGSARHPGGRKAVFVGDLVDRGPATAWWQELTTAGGEGMVVKPAGVVHRGPKGLAQPGIKCRGPEYLRLIYGPEYRAEPNLARLRSRGLGLKRSLALREFALGIEALERFTAGEPLYRVHECVFGVLALESEPVDPRL